MRKLITLLAVFTLAAPLMFLGCSGDDGAQGPAGPAGPPGASGDNGTAGGPGTGVVAVETCAACHGAGKTVRRQQCTASTRRPGIRYPPARPWSPSPPSPSARPSGQRPRLGDLHLRGDRQGVARTSPP